MQTKAIKSVNLISLSAAALLMAACGDDADELFNGLNFQLMEATAGGVGGDCPGSFVDFTLRASNQTGQRHRIEIGRIFVIGKSGAHIGGLSDGVLEDGAVRLTLETGAPFAGTIEPGADLLLTGHGEFWMGSANCADSACTWHTEIEVLTDEKLATLAGEPQTDIWPHTECYLTPPGRL